MLQLIFFAMNRIAAGIVIGVCALVGIFYLTFNSAAFYGTPPEKEYYEILQKWELPDELEEISALVLLGQSRVACIQDEEGKIFIYNLKEAKIEKEIEFGDDGDYEGLAINNKDAYVLRSDGVLFEVNDYESKNPEIKKYKTGLTAHQNTEGLCLDKDNNRLLIAIKSREKDDDKHKGIYAFDLSSKTLSPKPAFMINLEDPIFNRLDVNQLTKKMSPSDIAQHPETGDFYLVDGRRPKLLILSASGKPKDLYLLNRKDFHQPEGIGFSREGDMYISDEGHGNPPDILKVRLMKKEKGKEKGKEKE